MFRFSILVAFVSLLLFEVFRFSFAQIPCLFVFVSLREFVRVCVCVCFCCCFFSSSQGSMKNTSTCFWGLACVFDLSARKIHFGTQQTAPSTLKTLVIQVYNIQLNMVSHWKLQCQWPMAAFIIPSDFNWTNACMRSPVNTSYHFQFEFFFLLCAPETMMIARLTATAIAATHCVWPRLAHTLYFKNSIKFNLLLFRLFLDIIYADNL